MCLSGETNGDFLIRKLKPQKLKHFWFDVREGQINHKMSFRSDLE